jgi:hypothetical protein
VAFAGRLLEGRAALMWGALGFGAGAVFGFSWATLAATIGPAKSTSRNDFCHISLFVEGLFIANSWRSNAL